MASSKRLSSVSHSIAHHAVSSLSYVHPHLRQASRSLAETTILIDLLAPEPCPERYLQITPLRLSLNSLKKRFVEILISEGLSTSELSTAVLLFEFTSETLDDYCGNCHSLLVSTAGKEYIHAVNHIGVSISPNKALKSFASLTGTG